MLGFGPLPPYVSTPCPRCCLSFVMSCGFLCAFEACLCLNLSEGCLQIASRTLFVPWDEAGTLCPVGDFFNYACPGVSYDSPNCDTKSSVKDEESYGLEIRDRLRDGGFEHEKGEYCFYARQDYQEGQQVIVVLRVINCAHFQSCVYI